AVLLVSLSPVFWYRNRLRSSAAIRKRVSECAARLSACQTELRKTEDEARQIETEIRKLTGQSEILPGDIESRIAELNRLTEVSGEIRKLEEGMAQSEAEIGMIEHQIGDTRVSLTALLDEGGAASESEFLGRADIYKQRQQIILEIEKIPVEPQE